VGVNDVNEAMKDPNKTDSMIKSQEKPVGQRDVVLKELVEIDKTKLIDMINIIGMPQSTALDALTQAGLKSVPNVIHDYSSDVPAGYVIRQEPKPGTKMGRNDGVNLVVAIDLPYIAKRMDSIQEKMLTVKDLESLQGKVDEVKKEMLTEKDRERLQGQLDNIRMIIEKDVAHLQGNINDINKDMLDEYDVILLCALVFGAAFAVIEKYKKHIKNALESAVKEN